jgi:NADH-quinone oxidoreductase subunit G
MASVIVDNKEVPLGDGERINGIQAAARAGIEVPHYCWHAGLSVVASCRMCLVEVGKKDDKTGKVAMQPRLVPACQTPATDGTVFVTNSEKVAAARAMVEEDLLLRHPVDCPICDKAGECSLQDYHFEYGREERRAEIKPFNSRRRSLGDTVTLFVDRCVMCTRCVRFTREVSGTGELMVINRGAHEEIDVFRFEDGEIRFPLENKLSGNVVDLCPVGALGDKDFLYKQRVWFMKSHDGVCANCSTGCSIRIEENQDRIYRLKPRENLAVNGWWMCDEGRYGWKHVHDERRVTELRKLEGGKHVNVEWSQVSKELDAKLRTAGKLAAVLSPELTVEEAYLLATYIRSIDPSAVLALGPVPVVGEDEHYPKGFVIHAEKAPNRRGVEPIVARLGGGLVTWDELLPRVAAGEFGGVWVTGGYPAPVFYHSAAESFAAAPLLIVQDCFASPLWERANYQLPGGTYPEREGSFVNFNEQLQSFRWAIRAPAGVQVEGQLYWRLNGRTGLYNGRKVMEEVSREIAYFALAANPVPETGVNLRVNQLANETLAGSASTS